MPPLDRKALNLDEELPMPLVVVVPVVPLEYLRLGECGAIGLVLYETATAPACPPRWYDIAPGSPSISRLSFLKCLK